MKIVAIKCSKQNCFLLLQSVTLRSISHFKILSTENSSDLHFWVSCQCSNVEEYVTTWTTWHSNS